MLFLHYERGIHALFAGDRHVSRATTIDTEGGSTRSQGPGMRSPLWIRPTRLIHVYGHGSLASYLTQAVYSHEVHTPRLAPVLEELRIPCSSPFERCHLLAPVALPVSQETRLTCYSGAESDAELGQLGQPVIRLAVRRAWPALR